MSTHDQHPDRASAHPPQRSEHSEPLEFDLDTPPVEPPSAMPAPAAPAADPGTIELEYDPPVVSAPEAATPGHQPAAPSSPPPPAAAVPAPQPPAPRVAASAPVAAAPSANSGAAEPRPLAGEVAPEQPGRPVAASAPTERPAAALPADDALDQLGEDPADDGEAGAAIAALGDGERREAAGDSRPGRRRSDLPGPDLAALSDSGLSPRHQLEAWLAEMVKVSASDLILRAGGRPSCRVDTRIIFLPGRVPAAGPLQEVLLGIIGETRMEQWRQTGSADVALQLDGLGRFRLNAYRQMGDPALVLRRVADTPPKLETLCLPTGELQKLAKRRRGIVLVTGVAGSGKSTTLSAMIQHMNTSAERHVITLEDPVELIYQEERCVISQREIGTDVSTFHEGLRHALRQSPDVILIGEMRDAETVQAALDATETGHLVLSTLHTVNAAQTVDRIISFFPSEQHKQIRLRLADNLAAVLSQRLIPRREVSGMVPALELMTSTPRVRELLGEGRTAELGKVIESGDGKGLISFNQSLRQLVEAGLVELETALAASDRPDELLLALRGFTTAGGRGRQAQEQGNGRHLRLETNSDLDMDTKPRRS